MSTTNQSTRVKAPTIPRPEATELSDTLREDENSLSNPQGRSEDDVNSSKVNNKKLMNCKKNTLLSTMNLRTLKAQPKQNELAFLFKSKGIMVLGIQDHKIVHDEEIRTEEIDGCTLITTPAWRNDRNAAVGGVGLMISKYAVNALADVIAFNRRIIIAHFNGNPAVTLIVQYSPTEGSEEAEEHYTKLADAISSIPKHNVLIIVGDFNAHLGSDDARYTYHTKTNKNGQLLLYLAAECNLIITNTTFQKRSGKLWTYLSDMSGTKTQIDYILINKKWKNSVKNVEAYSTFSSLGSDHRIVTARLKLSLRSSITPPRENQFDWNTLRSDIDLQHRYTITIRNRYEQLYNEDESATEAYQHLIDANNQAAEEMIPHKRKRKKKETACDHRVECRRKEVNEAFSVYVNQPIGENEVNLQNAKELLKETYETVEREILEEQIKKVEIADERAQHSESWKLINEISNRKKSKKGIIKGENKESRIKSWYDHFSQLLGKEPVITEEPDDPIPPINDHLDIKQGSFTIEEYQTVKKKITENKAAGSDKIPPEVLKRCDLDDIFLKFANNLLINRQKPQQWSDLDIVTIPNKGDLGYPSNYRGISLSSIVAKTVNRLILNRIQPALDHKLRPNQNGFRPRRSTTAQILSLRRLIEGIRSNNLKAALLFIDFKKAFDSVHRGKMMKILAAYGIPKELCNAISTLYEGTRARILTPDGETDYFDLLAGVLQGDTLAPYIFVIVIDYVMRNTIGEEAERLGFTLSKRKSRRVGPVVITDLDFADDLALIAEEIKDAQEMLTRLENEAEKVGLHLNVGKTEVMIFDQNAATNLVASGGEEIKVVDDFKYLGSYVNSSSNDIKIRKALAWSACHKMTKFWRSSLSRSLKIRLFIATVESVLLYGCSTWTLTQAMEKSLDGTYTRMLRMALGIKWMDHITNEEVYGNLPRVTTKIAERRCKLAGHCVRHPEEEASKLVLWEPAHGRVNRGRKKTTYIDMLKRDTGLNNIMELRTAMMDRNTWKIYVSLARTGVRPK